MAMGTTKTPGKNTRWRKQKYFANHVGQDWSFFGEVLDDEGQPKKIWLLRAAAQPSSDMLKYKVNANPYDPPMRPTSRNAKKSICRNVSGYAYPSLSLA